MTLGWVGVVEKHFLTEEQDFPEDSGTKCTIEVFTFNWSIHIYLLKPKHWSGHFWTVFAGHLI